MTADHQEAVSSRNRCIVEEPDGREVRMAGPWKNRFLRLGDLSRILVAAIPLLVLACGPIDVLEEPLVLPQISLDPNTEFPAPQSLQSAKTPDGKFVFKISRLNIPDDGAASAGSDTSAPAARPVSTERAAPASIAPQPSARGPIDEWLPLVVDPAIRTSSGSVRRNADVFVRNDGMTTSLVGNIYFNSDGSFTQRNGDTFIHSDGTSTVRRGDTFLHSDGTVSRVIDNRIERSNGVRCTLQSDIAICR